MITSYTPPPPNALASACAYTLPRKPRYAIAGRSTSSTSINDYKAASAVALKLWTLPRASNTIRFASKLLLLRMGMGSSSDGVPQPPPPGLALTLAKG